MPNPGVTANGYRNLFYAFDNCKTNDNKESDYDRLDSAGANTLDWLGAMQVLRYFLPVFMC
jgi:hypothetical protein